MGLMNPLEETAPSEIYIILSNKARSIPEGEGHELSDRQAGRGGGLSGRRMEKFLGWRAPARLAVNKPDGSPSVIPAWYHWDGEALWFVGRERSEWCRHLDADPRIAVVVDVEGPIEIEGESFLTPKVLFEGKAEIVERPGEGNRWVEVAKQMAERYRGRAGLEYLEASRGNPRWLIRVAPTRILSWEGGGWAKRYKVESLADDPPSDE